MAEQGFNFGFDDSTNQAAPTQAAPVQAAQSSGGFDFGFDNTDQGDQTKQAAANPRYHTPKPLLSEISDKGFISGIKSWLRDDGSTVIKRQDGQTLQSQDGGTTWTPYVALPGDTQLKPGGPIVNLMAAGQKPGTITHHNPIVPLPGEDFKDTMKRAIEAGKKITPEQLKEDEDENLKEAPATLATAAALGATGPVVYGGAKGVSILKQALVGGDSQILGHPENMTTPEIRKAHPYWAGAMETVGGLSGPENAAMLIGSGALGKLPGAASKITARLVSGGFGISMISNAVRTVPEMWDVMQGNGRYADMSDDDRESLAKNMMFHLTADAAMGAQALEHGATGTSTPLTEYGEAADMMLGKAANKVAQLPQKAYGATVNGIGAMLGRTNDFDTAIKRASKIPSKQMAAHVDKIANVSEDLQSILNANPNIEDPKMFSQAIDEHIKQEEAKLQSKAGATKGSEEPVVPNIMNRLVNRLNKFFDDNKGLYGDEQDVSDAVKRVLEGTLQSRNGQHLLEPNLFEAENVRRRFSRQGKPQFATNAVPTTDAFKAASLEAADELRSAIDESYDAKGVNDVKQFRQKEANLIDVRDKLLDAQDKAEKMGEGSVFRSLMKKIGAPSSVLAIAFGHPISSAAVGAAVLGDQIAQNITNPNVNINRAMDIARQHPNARTTVPNASRVNTPLHGALASHYGELVGQSTYPELEGRFMAELAAKKQRGQVLEPAEKKILDQLNEAHLQDRTAQAKAQEKLKKNIPPPLSATLPEDHEDVMPIEGKMPNNMGTQEALVHDLAHIVVGDERGIKFVDGIRSHNHSENQGNSLLSAPIDYSPFVDEDGNADPDKIKARIADITATFMAGAVANDLWHGIPIRENEGLHGDISALSDMFRSAGFTKQEITKLLSQGMEDAAQSLSRPGVREMLEQHASVREPGLDNKHHFSEDRVNQVIQDVRRANETGTGKSSATARKRKPANKEAGAGTKKNAEAGNAPVVPEEKQGPAGGEGRVAKANEPGAEPDKPEPIKPSEPKLSERLPKQSERPAPPERTTGDTDEPIKAGGAIPGGVQSGEPELGIPDYALFHDPITGSTLALPKDKVTAENVARELRKSRDQYIAGEDKKAALDQVETHNVSGGSTFTPEGESLAGKDKYAVGSYPERTVQVDKLTPEALQKFKEDNQDLLSQPGHAVGTWKDPDTGKSVLDISKIHENRDEAIAAGKAANQKSIYHLGGQGEIQTGGTGTFGREPLPHDYYTHDWKGQARSAFDSIVANPTEDAIEAAKNILDKIKPTKSTPGSPKLSVPDSELDKWLEDKSGYHPDLQAVIKNSRSLHNDPAQIKDSGTFIAPDGRISNIVGMHPQAIEKATGRFDEADNRPKFLDDTGAIRTRFTRGRDRDRLAVSVPKTGVTPEQLDTIRQAVGSVGRNGNLLLERSDTSALNDRSQYKEFATPKDVEPMLRSIGAHPDQVPQNPKLSPKGSTVPLMKNPLEIEGTGEGEKINTLDVAKALNQFTKKKIGALELGKADPQEMTRRGMKLAEDEAKYQLNQNNSGKAWYTTDISVHDDALKQMRPELADPAKMSLFKMSEAVLSAGQKPYGNLKAAIRAWDHYNETGEFSPTNPANGKSWGPRSTAAYGNAMEMINRLIKEKGEQGASDWLLSEHPVKELRQYNKLGVSGKNDEQKLGAMILGEKRGPFAQNLHGIESAFTADMWVSRTWNRWMGTIEHDPETGEITTDAPRNGQERKLMTESFSKTADKLGLSTSALQAVLWFYEQGLYDVHGAKKESWSFADAAKRVQKEQAAKPEDEEFSFGKNEKPEIDPRSQGILELMRSTR